MYKKFGKRLIDIIGALIILPGFLMLLIPVGIGIWIEDRGSIFYNAKRLGRNGKIFKMYKFRSMKMGAPCIKNEDGSTLCSQDDDRVTKVGKFIRKTSIDELPQIINVLKGDMSFIGPRPDLPEDMDDYIGHQKDKLLVQPGITGYSQAYYRNSITATQKYDNDAWYAKNYSVLMDFKIVFKSLQVVVLKKNIYNDYTDNKLDM